MKIGKLNCDCENCPDRIFELCSKYCNYFEKQTAICLQEKYADMNTKQYRDIETMLAIDKMNKNIR